MDIQQLSDFYEIQLLKARYFRLMDTRQWDEWRDLFTDDLQFFLQTSRVPNFTATTPTFDGADALVDHLRKSVQAKITIHHGHMPEIEFVDANTATGIWAMFDWVDDPGRGGAWQGFGHYHERYIRCGDGKWRISSVHLSRLRSNTVPPLPSEYAPGPAPSRTLGDLGE